MAKYVFVGEPGGDRRQEPNEVNFRGMIFKFGEPVEVDEKNAQLIAKLDGNSHFEKIGGGMTAASALKERGMTQVNPDDEDDESDDKPVRRGSVKAKAVAKKRGRPAKARTAVEERVADLDKSGQRGLNRVNEEVAISGYPGTRRYLTDADKAGAMGLNRVNEEESGAGSNLTPENVGNNR